MPFFILCYVVENKDNSSALSTTGDRFISIGDQSTSPTTVWSDAAWTTQSWTTPSWTSWLDSPDSTAFGTFISLNNALSIPHVRSLYVVVLSPIELYVRCGIVDAFEKINKK